MFEDKGKELVSYIFLVAFVRMIGGISLEQIQMYLAGKGSTLENAGTMLDKLVSEGALVKKENRYWITMMGELFLREQLPDAGVQWSQVRQTMVTLRKIDGSTIEQLAFRFGAAPNDPLFRELIQQFIVLGSLEDRDGRYYVSEQAKVLYKLDTVH